LGLDHGKDKAGGIVKAEGLGDGSGAFRRNHRQAALDDATRFCQFSAAMSAAGRKEHGMRAVIQRVSEAKVEVEGKVIGQVGRGLLVYLGVGKRDTPADAEFMADKLVNLRIFADEAGKMNRSVLEIGGGVLLVSNFTLQGDCRKGRRPGFDAAADPQLAEPLYEKVAELIARSEVPIAKGSFGAHMQVSSINDGPVTFLLDSRRLF
jgi:D-tyrosyl-tRNA(Tyr) deacylase